MQTLHTMQCIGITEKTYASLIFGSVAWRGDSIVKFGRSKLFEEFVFEQHHIRNGSL